MNVSDDDRPREARSNFAPCLWMAAGSACFAAMAVLTNLLREDFPWQAIATARASVALVATLFWAWSRGVRLVVFDPPTLWMRSLAGTISMLAGFYAMTHATAASAGSTDAREGLAEVVTILNMYPLWVAVLAWPLLGRGTTVGVWCAVLVGVVGVYLLKPGGTDGATSAFRPSWSLMIALLASLASGVALIGLHKLKGVASLAIVVHFSFVATVLCGSASIAGAVGSPETFFHWSARPLAYAGLIGVGLCATLGQVCLTRAFATGEPGAVSAVGLSQVFFTALMEIALFGRGFSSTGMLGMLLVLAPTAWVLLGERARAEAAVD